MQKPVLIGSHLDTQPEGGRFDGVYGVLAALELVRTLNDHGIVTSKPIEIVSWTNEEGARFTPAMLGSAVFVGATPLQTALDTKDADGVSLRDALGQCGYAGTRKATGQPVDAYFEAHIEQGPVLESHGNPIGVVTGGQAIRWLDVNVTGVAAHAGTTPMPYRRDALFASADMALQLEAIAAAFRAAGSRHDRTGRDSELVAQYDCGARRVHGRPASSRRRANRRDGARRARSVRASSRERAVSKSPSIRIGRVPRRRSMRSASRSSRKP